MIVKLANTTTENYAKPLDVKITTLQVSIKAIPCFKVISGLAGILIRNAIPY